MKQQDLFRHLIKFKDITVAHLANLSKVSRPNIYAWLNEKPKIISQEREIDMMRYLGLEDGTPSTNIVHKWNIDPSAKLFKALLVHFYGNDLSQILVISFINTGNGLFNVVRIPTQKPGATGIIEEVVILVSCNDPLSRGYPVNNDKLDISCKGRDIYVSEWQWNKWWEDDLLIPQTFNMEYGILIENAYTSANQQDKHNGSAEDVESYVALKLSYKKQMIEKTAENAGLRAIIRGFMRDLKERKIDSEFLDKKRRDITYKEFYDAEFEKLNGTVDEI